MRRSLRLVLQRRAPRVDLELAINIGVAASLKAHISFLRVLRKSGHMAEGNHLIGMLIHEAHTGRDRPASIAVDHPANNGFSRGSCLSAAWFGERRRGKRTKKTPPAVVRARIGAVVSHGHKQILEDRPPPSGR